MDSVSYLQFIFALAAVLGLILTLAWLLKKSGLSWLPKTKPTSAGRRLAVEEALSLGPRRRLVIVSCDGREHLLVLRDGPGADLVVESRARGLGRGGDQ